MPVCIVVLVWDGVVVASLMCLDVIHNCEHIFWLAVRNCVAYLLVICLCGSLGFIGLDCLFFCLSVCLSFFVCDCLCLDLFGCFFLRLFCVYLYV